MSHYPGSPGYPPAYSGGMPYGPRPAAANAKFYWKVAGIGLGIGLLLCVILVAVVLALFSDKLFRSSGASWRLPTADGFQKRLVGEWQGTSRHPQLGPMNARITFTADQRVEMHVNSTRSPPWEVRRSGSWEVRETLGFSFARVHLTFDDGAPGPREVDMRVTFRDDNHFTDGPDNFTRVRH